MVAEALSTITNCVTPPPALAQLLPSGSGGGGGGGGTTRAGGGGGGGWMYGMTPGRRPDRAPAWGGFIEGGGLQAEEGAAGARPPSALAPAVPPPLDLGPPAPTLGQALEAGYVLARQIVRQSNGIRTLMQLLQPRHGVGPHAVPPAALDRIRALACRALVGLAGDPAIRQILTRLQLARLLSELVREPLGGPHASHTLARRPTGLLPYHEPSAGSGAVPYSYGPYVRGGGTDWHAAFTSSALELIALTTTGTGPMTRHADKFTAAANDATAPALHKIERAAIAASSHVSYNPQELLLLVYEHLKASGLHTSAAALAAEANLARANAALHKLMHLQTAPHG
ncbi:hypothetical protein Agub_g3436, partial [Astrephomene gubernaculifera]